MLLDIKCHFLIENRSSILADRKEGDPSPSHGRRTGSENAKGHPGIPKEVPGAWGAFWEGSSDTSLARDRR